MTESLHPLESGDGDHVDLESDVVFDVLEVNRQNPRSTFDGLGSCVEDQVPEIELLVVVCCDFAHVGRNASEDDDLGLGIEVSSLFVPNPFDVEGNFSDIEVKTHFGSFLR